MRVVFTGGGTGGHLYPALAIARALVRMAPAVRPFFIGAQRGIEREILPTTGFPHLLLDLHPLYRTAPWKNGATLVGLTTAWRRIGRLAREERPQLVVATGGYASGATLFWARWHGVPYVLQDQNSFVGATIRHFAGKARELYLGFPEAALTLPDAARARAIDSGNPIEPPPAMRPSREEARRIWGIPPSHGRIVLISGGSQGSAALNTAVDGWLSRGVPEGVFVIWATGHQHFTKYQSRMTQRVVVRPYIAPMSDAYAVADVAITRAGAMTTAELCAWGIPSILVPLPTAAADHQTANARALAQSGAARWLPQSEATAVRLDAEVRGVLHDAPAYAAMQRAALNRARPHAADDIARRLLTLLDLNQIHT